MNRGGYQIIDLKNVTLPSGTEETITGIYDRVTNNNRKAFLLCGVKVQASGNGDITELNDEVVNFLEGEDGYTASLTNGGTILVAEDDKVTYTEAEA